MYCKIKIKNKYFVTFINDNNITMMFDMGYQISIIVLDAVS